VSLQSSDTQQLLGKLSKFVLIDAGKCFVKDVVYVPLLPNDLQELKQRIIAAVATINTDMLETVWTEMNYRIAV
jgi:hypothetical protein